VTSYRMKRKMIDEGEGGLIPIGLDNADWDFMRALINEREIGVHISCQRDASVSVTSRL
jgi:hypothetical protein